MHQGGGLLNQKVFKSRVCSLLRLLPPPQADYIFVLDSERLANDLKKAAPDSAKVILVPKVAAAAQRSKAVRQDNRDLSVREYFHGRLEQLSPFRVSLPVASYSFYRLPRRQPTPAWTP